MGPGAVLVHESGGEGPILGSFLHSTFDLRIALHLEPADAFHVHSRLLTFPNFQPVHGALARVLEQVLHLLIVDLQHAQGYLKLFLSLHSVSLDILEYFLAGHRHDAAVRFVTDH